MNPQNETEELLQIDENVDKDKKEQLHLQSIIP